MANRVTYSEVQAIMGDTTLTEAQILPFITTANLYITTVFTDKGMPEANLVEIEKWLSAHLIALVLIRTTKIEELGDAKVTYSGWWGSGLLMTQYGQMVLILDHLGVIQAAMKRQASIFAVTSFT